MSSLDLADLDQMFAEQDDIRKARVLLGKGGEKVAGLFGSAALHQCTRELGVCGEITVQRRVADDLHQWLDRPVGVTLLESAHADAEECLDLVRAHRQDRSEVLLGIAVTSGIAEPLGEDQTPSAERTTPLLYRDGEPAANVDTIT